MSAKIHFLLRTDRPQPDGSVQIYFQFVLSMSQRLKLATGKFISLKPEYRHLSLSEILALKPEQREALYCWDKDKQKVTKGNGNMEKLNQYLISQEKKANDIIIKYDLMNKPLTLEGFKSNFCKSTKNECFQEYFVHEIYVRQKHNLAEYTIKNYNSVINKIEHFRPRILIGDIDHKFLVDFENYMRKPITEGGCGNNDVTIHKNLKILRTLILLAIKNGDFLEENYPFKTFKLKEVDSELTTRDFLEPEDLAVLEKMYADHEDLEKPQHHHSVEDWNKRSEEGKLSPGEFKALERFLFCCYTGLRFRDMSMLSKSAHVFSKYVTNPQDNSRVHRHYIEMPMHKTKKNVVIPLIDKAQAILNKYDTEGLVFDKVSNQKLNEHLKNIQKKAKLDKYLTFHVARHSFATICFIYGISERVGQKLLGHRNRKFTEIYTHLSQNRLFVEMDKLNRGLNQHWGEEKDGNDDLVEMLPILKSLSREKLEQLKGLVKILGK